MCLCMHACASLAVPFFADCPLPPHHTLPLHTHPQDRYYGINDPVANKMLRRVGEQQGGAKLEPPEDK